MHTENRQDFTFLSDLTWEDLIGKEISIESRNPLCVPQDRLEDLEFFPNFSSDLISSSGLLHSPEHKSIFVDEFSSKEDPNSTLLLNDCETMNKPLFWNDYRAFPENHYREKLYLFGSPKQESEDKGKRVLYNFSALKTDKKQANGDVYEVPYVTNKKIKRTRSQRHLRNSSEDTTLRCTHCQAEKTPQWRIGPLGPKTLCNACGVRFKSGRLMSDYRPAASPSFDRQ
ncbi:GATA transcription factor 2-like [Forsythia ovata]|uniref:GATA transcription factor 2-like n=1 Tax=Forsythia ovata TaxID=205694 RepID=A0ABD1U8D4_9LAMI